MRRVGSIILLIPLLLSAILGGCGAPPVNAVDSDSVEVIDVTATQGDLERTVVLQIDSVDTKLLEQDALLAMTDALPEAMAQILKAAKGDTYSVEYALTQTQGRMERVYELTVYGVKNMTGVSEIARQYSNLSTQYQAEIETLIVWASQNLEDNVESALIDGTFPDASLIASQLNQTPIFRSVYINSLEKRLTYSLEWEMGQTDYEDVLAFYERLASRMEDSNIEREETHIRITGTFRDLSIVISLALEANSYVASLDVRK